MFAGLPEAWEFGFQPVLQPARAPCLWAVVVFSHRCSANFSHRLSSSLSSDSRPEGISAEGTYFSQWRLFVTASSCRSKKKKRKCLRSVWWLWFVTCKVRLADMRELFIWSKFSMAAVRILTSDSRLLLCALAACRNTWHTAFFRFMHSFTGQSLMRNVSASGHMVLS